jgi:hypothetical protein
MSRGVSENFLATETSVLAEQLVERRLCERIATSRAVKAFDSVEDVCRPAGILVVALKPIGRSIASGSGRVTTDAGATPFAVVVMSDRELKSTPAHRTISSRGCFAVTPAEWQRFKQKLLEEAQKSPGVTVTPGRHPNQARAYIGGAGIFPRRVEDNSEVAPVWPDT